MADEKILEEEVLDEEELDNVAGGTKSEVNDDRARLMKMGLYKNIGPHATKVDNIKAAFDKLGSDIGIKLNVKVDGHYSNKTGNKYYLNGNEVSRTTMWDYINDVYTFNKK